MRITTESGSVYNIDSRGICIKSNSEGKQIDAFKVIAIKAIGENVSQWSDLAEIPNSSPVVGKRMYISGFNTWWVSTAVVKVEEGPEHTHPPLRFRDKAAGE